MPTGGWSRTSSVVKLRLSEDAAWTRKYKSQNKTYKPENGLWSLKTNRSYNIWIANRLRSIRKKGHNTRKSLPSRKRKHVSIQTLLREKRKAPIYSNLGLILNNDDCYYCAEDIRRAVDQGLTTCKIFHHDSFNSYLPKVSQQVIDKWNECGIYVKLHYQHTGGRDGNYAIYDLYWIK